MSHTSLEFDMSKYDKSQEIVALIFECELMRLFGVPEWLTDICYNAHYETFLDDEINGVSVRVRYQRKSGDASTFLFNTLYLLAVLFAVYDVDDVIIMLLEGDDSLILMNDSVKTYSDASKRISDLFNLECKLLTSYVHGYFCSKFILVIAEGLFVVPDLLKMLVKWGRRDLKNFEHLEKYRVSTLDNMSTFANEALFPALAEAMYERYGGYVCDVVKVLRVMHTLVSDKEKFEQLFFIAEGTILCMDKSLPTDK